MECFPDDFTFELLALLRTRRPELWFVITVTIPRSF